MLEVVDFDHKSTMAVGGGSHSGVGQGRAAPGRAGSGPPLPRLASAQFRMQLKRSHVRANSEDFMRIARKGEEINLSASGHCEEMRLLHILTLSGLMYTLWELASLDQLPTNVNYQVDIQGTQYKYNVQTIMQRCKRIPRCFSLTHGDSITLSLSGWPAARLMYLCTYAIMQPPPCTLLTQMRNIYALGNATIVTNFLVRNTAITDLLTRNTDVTLF